MTMSNPIVRKACGVLGIASSWSVAWGSVFAALAGFVWLLRPQDFDPGESALVVAGFGAIAGFASGAVYGAILTLAERNRAVLELALVRVALWGALAAAVWPMATPAQDSMAILLCPLGAICAITAVAIVRRAERADSTRSPLARSTCLVIGAPLRWVSAPAA